ncbi:hypothetical protein OKW43_000887 [Paraburkholderia sp. WC7.3g]|uniref:Uncharacterized protein n=1 Tax=Paraburkholderia podalyriae TaxID=1938811 RepID=A0ABR7PJ43_9BURK|nr:hypothetical protein [Paraburkholderia podalyriae]MBC8746362.1 hypothetical protein [Paraburkholderia podalyriae]
MDELVSKSLVNVCFDRPEATYSLFECTRTYVAEKFQCAFDEHAPKRAAPHAAGIATSLIADESYHPYLSSTPA